MNAVYDEIILCNVLVTPEQMEAVKVAARQNYYDKIGNVYAIRPHIVRRHQTPKDVIDAHARYIFASPTGMLSFITSLMKCPSDDHIPNRVIIRIHEDAPIKTGTRAYDMLIDHLEKYCNSELFVPVKDHILNIKVITWNLVGSKYLLKDNKIAYKTEVTYNENSEFVIRFYNS